MCLDQEDQKLCQGQFSQPLMGKLPVSPSSNQNQINSKAQKGLLNPIKKIFESKEKPEEAKLSTVGKVRSNSIGDITIHEETAMFKELKAS